ncbi:MAG: metal-dependent hydrolase [Phycisphaerae bacterium]|nr:metal-dependent hydrolase [Phycisphaerae bacterium]|tara:strand:+ start:9831 stop:10505 length:675 start_codon:yes stop_codon:yes gene_type:complete
MSPTLTFHGHSAFILSDGEITIAIDPFFSGNPAATISAEEVSCTHIALTHGHEDHFGDTLEIAKKNDATVVAAYEIINYLAEHDHHIGEPGNPGGRIQLSDDAWIAFTHAFHSSSYQGRYMGMPCGLVIHLGGKTVYHCGDTDLFSDLELIGELYKPDVALIPIGDRYTMGPKLASKAADLIGAPVVVPIHYNTWPPIEVDVKEFAPSNAEVKVLQSGDSIRFD